MTPDTQITNVVSKDLDWARHHLFLLVAIVVLVIGSVYGVESILASRAHENFLQEQAILKQFQEQNAQIQKETSAHIDALTQQNTVLQQQLTTLAAAITVRDTQLIKDREQIKTLPPTQLSAKWGTVANEPAPALTAGNDFIVPITLAQKSVDALVTLPVLEQDKKDLETQLITETSVANNNDTKFQDEKKAHQSDQEACKQVVVTKDAEIKDIKAKNRKRNIIIAIVGAALGFGLRR